MPFPSMHLSIYTLKIHIFNLSSTYASQRFVVAVRVSWTKAAEHNTVNQREDAASFLRGLLLVAAAALPTTLPPPRKAASRSLFF